MEMTTNCLIPARRTKRPDSRILDGDRYRSVVGMLLRLTKKASLASGMSFEEMKAHADYLFVKACRRYDDRRGAKFSTFLYAVLRNGLVDYGQRECLHDSEQTRVFSLPDEDGVERYDLVSLLADEKADRAFVFSDWLGSLPSDEQAIVRLALTSYAVSLESLRQMAIEQLGFRAARVDRAIANIRVQMREIC